VQNPLLITSLLNFLGAVRVFSRSLPNEKKLVFYHRSILKEIVEFVNKVKNKQKESKSQAQVTGAVYIMKSLIPSMASKC